MVESRQPSKSDPCSVPELPPDAPALAYFRQAGELRRFALQAFVCLTKHTNRAFLGIAHGLKTFQVGKVAPSRLIAKLPPPRPHLNLIIGGEGPSAAGAITRRPKGSPRSDPERRSLVPRKGEQRRSGISHLARNYRLG